MNKTPAATLAALLSLITTPVRDFGGPPSAVAISVPQPFAWAALVGLVRRVPLPSRGRPQLPQAIFLYAAPAATADDFDAAMRSMVPAIRRAGLRAPYQADLPVDGVVGVATVRRVAYDRRRGWTVELGEVAPLPFFLELEEPPCAPIFDVAPGEAAAMAAWGEVLEGGHRTVGAAVRALVRMGFDRTWAEAFAASTVPAIAGAEATEAACGGRSVPAPPTSHTRLSEPRVGDNRAQHLEMAERLIAVAELDLAGAMPLSAPAGRAIRSTLRRAAEELDFAAEGEDGEALVEDDPERFDLAANRYGRAMDRIEVAHAA